MNVNPFLGARPYGPADDRIFFGRERASSALIERIDLHRLTILCSPSGLGKTSLLRASVMPQLEKSGLSPVYLRPDPPTSDSESGDSDAAAALLEGRLQSALLRALLPVCELEVAALRRVTAVAPSRLTLGKAQDWFSKLNPGDPSRAAILACAAGHLEVMSYVSRYLRGSMTLAAFHNQALRLKAKKRTALLVPETPLRNLLQSYPRDEVDSCVLAATEEIINRSRSALSVHQSGDTEQTIAILQRLCGDRSDQDALLARPDGDLGFNARVVLVLDQFEQIFTLGNAHSSRRALKLLGGLVTSEAPINIVLALRKEWYADLVQQLSQFLQQSDRLARNTFYLEPMQRDEAEEVMRRAPETVKDGELSPRQKDSIWRALQIDETIDPVVLSIACHEHFGSRASNKTIINDAGIESLLQAYLVRALQGFVEPDRNEALDILGEIAGTELTRGFATHDRLIDAPLVDPGARAKVLKGLQDAFLIKGEDLGRSRSKVYDIMHERLLTPVRQLLAKQPHIARFREAAATVTQEAAWEQGIGWEDCLTLLSSRRRISWDARSATVMLITFLRLLTPERSQELLELEADELGNVGSFERVQSARDQLRYQVEILARACGEAPRRGPLSYLTRAKLNWWMSQQEIRAQLAGLSTADADEFALKSLLQGPAGWMRDESRELTLRLSR